MILDSEPQKHEEEDQLTLAQDIFDKALLGVRRQGCAAAEYVPFTDTLKMEGLSVADLMHEWLLPDRLVPHIVLLDKMQDAHDQAAAACGRRTECFLFQFETAMQNVAYMTQLDYESPP
jgi:hypothetical protein